MEFVAKFIYGPMDGYEIPCEEFFDTLMFAAGERVTIGFGLRGATLCSAPLSSVKYSCWKKLRKRKGEEAQEFVFVWSPMVKNG